VSPQKIETLLQEKAMDKNQQPTTTMAYAVHLKLEELEKDNKELRAMLAIQARQIERNKQSIYAYAGGLYTRKELAILEDHLNIMEGQTVDEDYRNYVEGVIDSICPRTRDSHKHEERLTELEEKIEASDEAFTRLTALEEKIQEREEAFTRQMAVLEDNLTQIFKERDEQLTEFETKLKDMETKINAMEKMQLERLGLPL
jgi:chromosome segregation ATPase